MLLSLISLHKQWVRGRPGLIFSPIGIDLSSKVFLSCETPKEDVTPNATIKLPAPQQHVSRFLSYTTTLSQQEHYRLRIGKKERQQNMSYQTETRHQTVEKCTAIEMKASANNNDDDSDALIHSPSDGRRLYQSLRDGVFVCIPACVLLALLVLFLPHHCRGGMWASSNRRSAGGCDTPFGSVIGVSAVGSVTAYSNCNSDYTSNLSNYVNVTIPGEAGALVVPDVYTGMPWQCVEYARRYWATTSPFTLFGSVDGASDIWSNLHHGTFVELSDVVVQFDLQKFENGGLNTTSPPQVGDLLIYPVQPGGFPFGHVTVVLNTQLPPVADSGSQDVTTEVHVGEQNWDSFPWQHAEEGYSRKLQLTYHQLSKRYSIYDPQGRIAGWVRRPSQRP